MFCTAIDIEKLEYKAPTSNKTGLKVVNISTVPGSADWNDRIRFQMCEDERTNRQTLPWGLSTPMAGQDESRRSLELTIESPALRDFLTKLDDHNVRIATLKSEEWFKKQLTEDQVRNMYTPIVKEPKAPSNKETLKVKVKTTTKNATNVFRVVSAEPALEYVPGTTDDLVRNAKCMVMVETSGLWFGPRQFGMSIAATDIIVWMPKQVTGGIKGFTFAGESVLAPSHDFSGRSALAPQDDEMAVESPI
jgi:hypothetical protein